MHPFEWYPVRFFLKQSVPTPKKDTHIALWVENAGQLPIHKSELRGSFMGIHRLASLFAQVHPILPRCVEAPGSAVAVGDPSGWAPAQV